MFGEREVEMVSRSFTTKHPYGRVIKLNPETFERKIMKNKTKKKSCFPMDVYLTTP